MHEVNGDFLLGCWPGAFFSWNLIKMYC